MGGRTNAIELYAYCHGDEDSSWEDQDEHGLALRLMTEPCHRIRYIDVVSLYPAVMRDEEYPVGHPIIYTFSDLPSVEECTKHILNSDWFGIVKCDINAPYDLFFPVLPQTINHRLVFALCQACAENQDEECHHTEEQRRLLDGTWTTFELRPALTKGYQLSQVHEVWHYEERTTDLFGGYIRENLKIKMQASGWPDRCKTEEDKRQFMEEVKEREGIELDYDKVEKNPGLRSVAKLNLNSLWGKFGQNPFKRKTEYNDEPARYFELLTDDHVQVNNVVLLNEDMVQVSYSEFKETVKPIPYGNAVLAVCVPSHARLRLYAMLDKLGDRVLYHDTDSVIYKTLSDDQEEIPTGSCLGQWEDECGDPTKDWLVEYVALGPKSYAYRTKSHKTVVKCKGITLSSHARDLVDIESMKRLVVEEGDRVTVQYPRRIIREPMTKHLKTVSMNKDVRMTYTKRIRQLDGVTTLPFGYKKR